MKIGISGRYVGMQLYEQLLIKLKQCMIYLEKDTQSDKQTI